MQTADPNGPAVRCDRSVALRWPFRIASGAVSNRGDVDIDAAAFSVKPDVSVHQCVQRVIVSAPDVTARVVLGANLANDDGAGGNHFAAELLNATSLGVAVTAVAAAALTFLMCHFSVVGLCGITVNRTVRFELAQQIT